MEEWVKQIIGDVFGPFDHPRVGERWVHKGRLVQITGGQFYGEHGISNYWNFRYINSDGSLGEEGGDYNNQSDTFYRVMN